MKRILYVLSVGFLALTSCSKDDNMPNKQDSSKPAPVLVQRETYIVGDKVTNTRISYEGNKISNSISSGERVFKFTYTEDFITKSESFDKNGKLESTTEYTYEKGKLVTKIRKEGAESDFYYKTQYTHNGSTQIGFKNFIVTAATQEEEEYGSAGKYTYINGNLVNIESSLDGKDSITTFEYDTNNNPYINIKGYNLLVGENTSNFNNIVKRTYILKETISEPRLTTYVYKYNTKNYPTELTISYHAEDSVSTETTLFSY